MQHCLEFMFKLKLNSMGLQLNFFLLTPRIAAQRGVMTLRDSMHTDNNPDYSLDDKPDDSLDSNLNNN
jgi:hypothetical protein